MKNTERLNHLAKFILLLIITLTNVQAWAGSGITYHGKILRPDGVTPVSSVTTQFRIQVRTPGTENCLLWEEQQVKDLSGTGGVFTITIADSSEPSLIANVLPFTLDRVFSNRTNFSSLTNCSVGTTYNPTASDGRSLVVFFKENPADPWEQMPATKINFVPLALNSVQLAGYEANEFLKIDPLSSYTTLTAANVDTLEELIAGTNNQYLKPSTVFAGDVTGTASTTSVEKIRGVNVVATAPTLNQVLKFNGTNWVPSADDTGSAPADASYAAKGVVQINTDQATSGLFIASGVLAMPNVITAAGPVGDAQTIPVITYDQKGRLTTVTTATVNDTTKLPLAGGTMTGPINMGTHAITNASSVSANDFSGRNIYHYNLANTQYANVKAPDALSLNYTLTLPTTAPVAGNVLSTDASGNLSWIAPASGSVTNVTGTAPIVSSGGTTPAISLNTGNGLTVSSNNLVVDAGLGINKIPQVGGTALGANGVVVANGTATALTSLNCASGQVVKFDASGYAICGADTAATGNEFVNAGNSFGAAATLGTNDNYDLNFETNGSTKMTVLANGNVGIGTTTPGAQLHTNTSATGTIGQIIKWGQAGQTANLLEFQNNAGTILSRVDKDGKFYGDGSGLTGISASPSGAAGSIQFSNGTAFASDNSNLFWDDTNNRLGIGTASPANLLSLKTASDGGTVISVTNSNNNDVFQFDTSGSGTRPGTLKVTDGAASPVTMARLSGNYGGFSSLFGNGTANTTDGARADDGIALVLQVPHTVGNENGLYFTDNSGAGVMGAAVTHYITDTSGYGRGGLKFKTSDSGAPTTRMTIDPTGNVGIGTTTPGSRLEVTSSPTATTGTIAGQQVNYTWAPSAAAGAATGVGDLTTVSSTSNRALGTLAGEQVNVTYSPTSTGGTTWLQGSSVSLTASGAGSGGPTFMIGQQSDVTYSMGGLSQAKAFKGSANLNSAGTLGTAYGLDASVTTSTSGSAVISNAYGVSSQISSGSGSITTAYGIYSDLSQSGGAIQTGYGVYIGNVQATNKWSLYANDAAAPSYFAGNVGIGTTNPIYKLDVNGEIRATSNINTSFTAGSSGYFINGSTANNPYSSFQLLPTYARIGVGNDLGGLPLVLQETQGNVGIGVTSPQAALDVVSTGTSSAVIVPRATTGNRPTTLVNGMIRYNTTTTLFEFYQNGAWVNYTTVSDGRLKTNVEPVTDGLSIVNQLNPVFYDWDRSNSKTAGFEDRHQVGFIAQEVEKVLPEVVNKGEDSYRSLEYGKIVSVVVAAVKELYNKVLGIESDVDVLKAKDAAKDREIASVKAENAELKAKVQKAEQENAEMKARLDKIEKMLKSK